MCIRRSSIQQPGPRRVAYNHWANPEPAPGRLSETELLPLLALLLALSEDGATTAPTPDFLSLLPVFERFYGRRVELLLPGGANLIGVIAAIRDQLAVLCGDQNPLCLVPVDRVQALCVPPRSA